MGKTRKKQTPMPPTRRSDREPRVVERVQTGLRIEKRILKVLKGLAEYHELSLGDLVEGIVLHAFEGSSPFRDETLARIEKLKEIYGLDLTAADSHHLRESESS
jgi:hypothetical protein